MSTTVWNKLHDRLVRQYGDGTQNIQDGIHGTRAIDFITKEVKAPRDVIRMLVECIEIQPKGIRGRYEEPNNKSATAEMAFVRDKIQEYEKKGVVEKCVKPPRAINPLSVAKKFIYASGEQKKRLVLDVSRCINLGVEKMVSKPEELSAAEQIFSQGMWAMTLDLKSMYHHAALTEDSADLFGFRISNPMGGSLFYRFRKLPFGYKNSGALMQRLTNPLLRYLREQGVNINLYIDDFLIVSDSKQETADIASLVKLVFSLAGWTFEPDKSMKEPCQVVEYLGIIIDFQNMTYSLQPEKRKFIKDLVTQVAHENQVNGSVPARKLAECLGKLASVRKAIGPILSVCLRHTQHCLGAAVFTGDIENPNWEVNLYLDNDSIKELMLAHRVLATVQSRRIPPAGQKKIFSLHDENFSFGSDLKYPDENFDVFCSDASDKCAFVFEANAFKIVDDYVFNQHEQDLGSGRRELLAISYTLNKYATFFQNSQKNIFWLTDSQNAYFWLRRGSRHAQIQKSILDIKIMELQLDIEIQVIWQPRDSLQIQWADIGSKLIHSTDEWAMSRRWFKIITYRLGCTPTVDAFASRANAMLPTFFSKCPQIGTAGVNFFAQPLQKDQLYWCTPPVSIIVSVIKHILSWDTPVYAILNVPEWHSARFWPFLVRGKFFAPFVSQVVFTRPSFIAYNDRSNLFSGQKDFRIISCLISNTYKNGNLIYRC